MDKIYITWVGCVLDGADHAVTQLELAAGVHRGDGRYEAVCGHVVTPVSMLQPPGAPCHRCRVVLCARATLPTVPDRHGLHRHRQRGRVRRWRLRFPAPAGSGDAPTVPVPAGSHHARRGA